MTCVIASTTFLQKEINSYWLELRSFWETRGISCVSVRRRRDGEPGRLGLYDYKAYIVVTFDAITTALQNFICTNFVRVGDLVGRECLGVPTGDALSGAALRLFKWARERSLAVAEPRPVIRYPGEREQLVHFRGCNMLLLNVFRNDMRSFCAWDFSSDLNPSYVQEWALARFSRRYAVGSMELEQSDSDIFIGLHTIWQDGVLITSPRHLDPWGRVHKITLIVILRSFGVADALPPSG